MDIGHRVQAFRRKAGLSQEALAEHLGVTRQSVSKWELGQALPDVEKIVLLSRLFEVTTDSLLLDERAGAGPAYPKSSKQELHFGMYLIVKDFAKSVDFYENFLNMRALTLGKNRFAQFHIDKICMSIMNEAHLPGHDYTGEGDYKFVLNFWIKSLTMEHLRVRRLNIGEVSEIIQANCSYYFFNLIDPDKNIIEITGGI